MIDKITRDLYRRDGVIFAEGTTLLEGYRKIIQRKADLLSLEDLAVLRILNPHSELCKKGYFVREGMLYFPDNRTFLVRDSSKYILSKESKPLFLDSSEIALYFSSFIEVFSSTLPLNLLGNSLLGKFMFGDLAEDYAKFLSSFGTRDLVLNLAKPSSEVFMLPIYVDSMGRGSQIDATRNKYELQEHVLGYKF